MSEEPFEQEEREEEREEEKEEEREEERKRIREAEALRNMPLSVISFTTLPFQMIDVIMRFLPFQQIPEETATETDIFKMPLGKFKLDSTQTIIPLFRNFYLPQNYNFSATKLQSVPYHWFQYYEGFLPDMNMKEFLKMTGAKFTCTEKTLGKDFAFPPNLEKVELIFRYHSILPALCSALRHCHQLVELSLTYDISLFDELLELTPGEHIELVSNSLKTIILSAVSIKVFSEQGNVFILPKLKAVAIEHVNYFQETHIVRFLERFSELETLRFYGCEFSQMFMEELIAYIQKSRTLKTLALLLLSTGMLNDEGIYFTKLCDCSIENLVFFEYRNYMKFMLIAAEHFLNLKNVYFCDHIVEQDEDFKQYFSDDRYLTTLYTRRDVALKKLHADPEKVNPMVLWCNSKEMFSALKRKISMFPLLQVKMISSMYDFPSLFSVDVISGWLYTRHDPIEKEREEREEREIRLATRLSREHVAEVLEKRELEIKELKLQKKKKKKEEEDEERDDL